MDGAGYPQKDFQYWLGAFYKWASDLFISGGAPARQNISIQFRSGTAAEWLAANPILQDGEPGFERDTNQLKIGNGADDWNTLTYV